VAPSISFPESHDTSRLAAETDGLDQVQKLRYAFAAVFTSGVLMPPGFEFGARKKLDVVKTRPEDREPRYFDISPFIARMNELRAKEEIFSCEGKYEAFSTFTASTLILKKSETGNKRAALIFINKEWKRERRAAIFCDGRSDYKRLELIRPFLGERKFLAKLPDYLDLLPAEILFIVRER
jgi:starch synthase (maltosyl-transferring)